MTQPEHEQPSLFDQSLEIPFDPQSVAEAVHQGVLANPHQPVTKQPSEAAIDQGWGETAAEPEVVASPEQIHTLERLLIVGEEEGFYPTSRRELNEAFNLRSFRETPGGAAKHLAEVSAHQVKHNASPREAVRSIANEYFGYARRARTDKTNLLTLQEEVSDLSQHNRLETVKTSMISTGLGQLVRYIDLKKLAHTQDFSQFDVTVLRGYDREHNDAFDNYVSSEPSKEMTAHIESVISSMRLWQLSETVDAAITEQSKRFEFWVECLKESRRHSVARPIAYNALISLGIKIESIR